MNAQKQVSVSLPEELYRKIQTLAEETCRTRAGYIRQIIKAYLCEIEENPDRKLK